MVNLAPCQELVNRALVSQALVSQTVVSPPIRALVSPPIQALVSPPIQAPALCKRPLLFRAAKVSIP
jgi:hypothetical protein